MNRLSRFFSDLARRWSARRRSPGETVDRLLREMNRVVPPLADRLGHLHGRLRQLEEERRRLAAGAPGDGPDAPLAAMDRQIAAAREAHGEALRSLRQFIDERRQELGTALSRLKEEERLHEERECAAALECLSALGQTEAEGPGAAEGYDAARLRESLEKARRIAAMAPLAPSTVLRERVGRTAGEAVAIIEYLAGHPERLNSARHFVAYYLDATLAILARIMALCDSAGSSPPVMERLAAAEEVLGDIAGAFTKIREKIMEPDLMGLDVEIAVLKKALRSDRLA